MEKFLQKHVDTVKKNFPKNEFFYCGLYGSQNYGLSTENSDIDTKVMLLPTPAETILGKKKISTEVIMEDGSLSNVKDIREMFDNFYKGNINFLEILFTRYFIYNPRYFAQVSLLRANREQIANRNPKGLMTMSAGMAKQKYVAFDKPFESKKEILNKYGYDPKQLHHLVRLYYFMKYYMKRQNFEAALKPEEEIRLKILALKTVPMEYNKAKELRNQYMDLINDLFEKSQVKFIEDEKRNEQVRHFLNKVAYNTISRYLKNVI